MHWAAIYAALPRPAMSDHGRRIAFSFSLSGVGLENCIKYESGLMVCRTEHSQPLAIPQRISSPFPVVVHFICSRVGCVLQNETGGDKEGVKGPGKIKGADIYCDVPFINEASAYSALTALRPMLVCCTGRPIWILLFSPSLFPKQAGRPPELPCCPHIARQHYLSNIQTHTHTHAIHFIYTLLHF